MKKTTVLIAALFFAAISSYSFAGGAGDSSRTEKRDRIGTLIINADVTVVLVNNDKAAVAMTGGDYITKHVAFQRTGDTLVISSVRKRNLTGAGIIYVPATCLKKVHINREARVSSLYALQVPKLDVVINAACQFSISNIGELNLITNDAYTLEQSTEVRRYHPANIVWVKNI